MWRSIVVAALVYAYGHPKFDGHRPAAFDRAMQAFYFEVNKAAVAGHQMLVRFDERASASVKAAVENTATELTPSN